MRPRVSSLITPRGDFSATRTFCHSAPFVAPLLEGKLREESCSFAALHPSYLRDTALEEMVVDEVADAHRRCLRAHHACGGWDGRAPSSGGAPPQIKTSGQRSAPLGHTTVPPST